MLKAINRYKWPYLFILPFFLLFLVFQLVPVIYTVVISFTEWNGIGTPRNVGVNNYTLLFKDNMFWAATFNTFIYWVVSIALVLVMGLLMANLLTYRGLRFRKTFNTLTFLPNICAVISMAIIFKLLFDTNVGLLNATLESLGFARQEWLTGTRLSRVPVVVLYAWRNTPWYTMILASGMLAIPGEQYEAATVDGANVIQQFFHITLPSLANILFFCMISLTSDSWRLFNESYMLKGPGTSNISLFQYMYESGFTIFKMGYASAIGVILTAILLITSIVQFIIRKRQGEV